LVCQNARDLGIDENRIGVGGDSAGACFAAVVAQQARAKDLPDTKIQLLIYPVTDGNLSSQSVVDLNEAYMLNKLRLDWYRDLYAGSLEDYNDPKFSPLLARSFSKLPPACIVTGGFDPLWDDGDAYATKLEQANVPVARLHFAGQVHAFIHLTKVVPDGTRVLKNISNWLDNNW
jgi:acetyl esterase